MRTRTKHVFLLMVFLAFFSIQVIPQSYHYPSIPDSIQEKEARVSYMAKHFWDHADCSDPSLFIQPKLFLDYLYLLHSLPSEEERTECIKQSIQPFSSQPVGFNYLLFWLDRYLHNSQSPLYDDTFFLQFINVLLEAVSNEGQINELSYLKEMTQQNQIDSIAVDFSFVLKDGTKKKLLEVEAPLLLLIFNSPNCSLCHKLENDVSNNLSILHLIADNQLKILSVCPTADYEDWISHNYPQNWICGFDKDMTIITNRLYEIKQFPCIYLLDKDKRVIVKEADYDALVSFLFKQ